MWCQPTIFSSFKRTLENVSSMYLCCTRNNFLKGRPRANLLQGLVCQLETSAMSLQSNSRTAQAGDCQLTGSNDLSSIWAWAPNEPEGCLNSSDFTFRKKNSTVTYNSVILAYPWKRSRVNPKIDWTSQGIYRRRSSLAFAHKSKTLFRKWKKFIFRKHFTRSSVPPPPYACRPKWRFMELAGLSTPAFHHRAATSALPNLHFEEDMYINHQLAVHTESAQRWYGEGASYTTANPA